MRRGLQHAAVVYRGIPVHCEAVGIRGVCHVAPQCHFLPLWLFCVTPGFHVRVTHANRILLEGASDVFTPAAWDHEVVRCHGELAWLRHSFRCRPLRVGDCLTFELQRLVAGSPSFTAYVAGKAVE